MPVVETIIGPRQHGRKMSLKAFEFAKTEDGYLYELARGYIVVSEVANYFHAMQIDVILDQLRAFKVANRGVIGIANGIQTLPFI